MDMCGAEWPAGVIEAGPLGIPWEAHPSSLTVMVQEVGVPLSL